jgi:1,2-diacylglycerol 3-alpha-glucosyltransferase
MKILLVTDQYFSANNGMTISSRRFAKVLRDHGHEVRIVSTDTKEGIAPSPDAYLMKKQYIPIFDKLVTSQGMTFAKPNDDLLREAIKWADVVHFLSPFTLTHHGIRIAQELHKPYTAAFHVQPENITSSIHMGKVSFVNSGIYLWFRHYIYKECKHIHCPSNFIAGELKQSGYQGQLHVISNGIDPDFTYRKLPKSKPFEGKFVILMIGRLSIEKRQDVLIRAVAQSRYANKIQLVLAGNGPRKNVLSRLAEQLLPNPIRIQFFSKSELLDMIAMSDLYVHAADMEIEAMSCMEAFAGGLVPIIANSPKSATPQFALDERSLFRAGDSADLAHKIDYWMEHEDERKKMELRYSELGKRYSLDDCVRQAEKMFEQAIQENERA